LCLKIDPCTGRAQSKHNDDDDDIFHFEFLSTSQYGNRCRPAQCAA
jgi:hypothetical protein